MDSNVVTRPATVCSCAVPLPKVKAAWKGAARTFCARCDLPLRIAFEAR